MSNKYKHGDEIPLTVIIMRLADLAKAVVKKDWSEFSMRIPAELDRDADLVLSDAAMKIKQQAATIKQLEVENKQQRLNIDNANSEANELSLKCLELEARCKELEGAMIHIKDEFPLIDEVTIGGEVIDEDKHYMERLLLMERKRLHRLLK